MKIKSRKLFAILIITAMVLAMLPMSVFAAPNRFASTFTVDKTEVIADGVKTAKFTVYVFDDNNQIVTGAAVTIASDRAGTDKFDNIAGGIIKNTDAEGKVEFLLKSSIVGTAKVGIALTASVADLQAHLQGGTGAPTPSAVGLVGTQQIVFVSASVDEVVVDPVVDGVADGLTQTNIYVTVIDKGGNPVRDQEITFSANKSGLSWDKVTYKTNVAGRVTAKVTSTVATTYTVRASAGSLDSDSFTVKFNPQGIPYDVIKVGGDSQLVGTTFKSGWLTVSVVDINGNKIADTGVITIQYPTKPSGAADPVVSDLGTDESNVRFKLTPSADGDYVVRVRLDNGKNVTFNMTAQEMGKITGLTLSYKESFLPHGKLSSAPAVKWVDNAGVGKDATGLIWALSNTLLGSLNSSTGVFTATTDTKKTGAVTITAIDEARSLVATATITVGSAPSLISLAAGSAIVGADAVVTLNVLNDDGQVISFGASGTLRTLLVKVISKPAGSLVTTSQPSEGKVDEALEQKGILEFKVNSNTAGNVVVQAIVDDGTTKYTQSVTLNFAPAAPPKADFGTVVMFIGSSSYVADGKPGSMDVAPFIEGGRTFVPVRFIAEAFGCEADWFPKDAAVKTVTLTSDDIEITITIGEYTIVVVRDGVTETVVSDVAAFIRDGRTFLPLRAIGEIFGAEFDWGPKDAGTEWVSFS